MDERVYSLLKWTAVILTTAWVGWSAYDSFLTDVQPGTPAYLAANNLFEDGAYQRALDSYQQALHEDPEHIHALRGKARSLLKLKRYQESLHIFNEAISKEPDFAGTYANRGILYDWMGQHQAALLDYERALQGDDTLGEGPNWFSRFFRLQAEKPPTIVERARYLREQLAKPKSEQQLRRPDDDEKQRPYKI
ncbi:MAG: tetratricopeptide repeat protein [Thiomargarita sp.]|nr:tetratricopeptide repeat protein [Thiomargarita sp.]